MRRLALLAVILLAVLVFGVGQLVLPGVAASILRNRLGHYGRVISVRVSAFPAIQLLWQSADGVAVRMATYRSGSGHLSSLLDQTSSVGRVDASVGTLRAGLLTLHDVVLRKRGDEMTGQARLYETDLRASIPFLDSVQFLGAQGNGLALSGTGTVLGVTASVPVSVEPRAGRLLAAPDVPLGGLATVTVFSDPHVYVQSVGGAAIPEGLTVSARARVS